VAVSAPSRPKQQPQQQHHGRRQPLSDAERAARLAEMEANAAEIEGARRARLRADTAAEAAEADAAAAAGGAAAADAARRAVFAGASEATLEQRVNSRRHYNARGVMDGM